MRGLIQFLLLSAIACAFATLPPICSAQNASPQQLPFDHVERIQAGTNLFRDRIRSALIERCLKCHGDEKVRSGFDLSSRKLLLEGGDSGEVLNMEDPDASYLLQLIRHDDEPAMPPATEKLPDNLIDDIKKWIELGAPYDSPLVEKKGTEPVAMQVTQSDREFWSFLPLTDQRPPSIESEWPRTDTDRFILSKLHEKQIQPSPATDDRSRIRRAYLDVIGLPPTPQQVEAGLKISHEVLVDQLLESPHYGERWARHWLDAARFAESHGFEQDYDRKFAYHYRDFVIKALNSDMPWDQFVRWQIAGDEIAPDDPLAMMATGFLGAGVFPTQLTEKEFESARYDELDDMAATVGTAMLGLTIGCARCHDHKFDPLPVADYYRFVSTFSTTIRSEIDIDLDPVAYQSELAKWTNAHDVAVKARDDYRHRPAVQKQFADWLETDIRSHVGSSEWTILGISSAESSQAATTLESQPDGAVLAKGNPPTRETYTVKATTAANLIRSIRVEALTHPSMKRKGPGRAGNGNFALSNLKVFAKPLGTTDSRRQQVKLKSAKATHQQNESHLSVAAAIDDETDKTGWAVDKGGIGKDQAAVFQLASPFQSESGVELEFRMTFTNNAKHSLGRFRLSISSDVDPEVVVGGGNTQALASALSALEKAKRDENLGGKSLDVEHLEALFPAFAASNPQWTKLNEAVQKSLGEKPKPQLVKVQVSSEGFKPTKHHADGRGFPHFYPETYFLERGDPNQKQGIAPSGFLQVLMRNGKTSEDWQQAPPPNWTRTSYRRTAMANWISDTEHGAGHLLARVIVNRLWHHHLGHGIVTTTNDFGLQGTLPTHPELLDYLAQRLIANEWKLKSIHREILCSATWLQSSSKASASASAQTDPENRYFWRYPTRRLEAEIVRDTMLAASGQLNTKMFGPGTLDATHRRRSIYFMIKRSRLVPMMQIFDQPEPLSSQGSRPSTTIAPQALLFMNNNQVVKWAAALAAAVDQDDVNESIREVYLRTLAREPNSLEYSESGKFIAEQSASYADSNNARQLALADFCQIVFGLNEFVYMP